MAISGGPQSPSDGGLGGAGQLFLPVAEQVLQPSTTRLDPGELVRQGNLITFSYTNWRHDPWPLVIVTDMVPGFRLRGVNLHYLRFEMIRELLSLRQANPAIAYKDIQQRKYLVDSFRTYKWNGIQKIKKLDVSFLLQVMSLPRMYDANDVKKIRELIQEQIRERLDPTRAADVVQQTQTPQVGPAPTPQPTVGPKPPPETGQQ